MWSLLSFGVLYASMPCIASLADCFSSPEILCNNYCHTYRKFISQSNRTFSFYLSASSKWRCTTCFMFTLNVVIYWFCCFFFVFAFLLLTSFIIFFFSTHIHFDDFIVNSSLSAVWCVSIQCYCFLAHTLSSVSSSLFFPVCTPCVSFFSSLQHSNVCLYLFYFFVVAGFVLVVIIFPSKCIRFSFIFIRIYFIPTVRLRRICPSE